MTDTHFPAGKFADAFRTFAVDPPYAVRTLRTQLLKARTEFSMQITEGYAKDWPDYQRRIGVIEGLAIAAGLCDEMEKQERK